MESGDMLLYLNIFLLSFSGWCLLYLVLYLIFKRNNYFFANDGPEQSHDDKFWRVQGWVLIAHHTLAVVLSIYSIRNSCLTEDGDESVHWQWVRSDECFAKVSQMQVCIVIMSIGFLIFDFILMKLSLENQQSKIVRQTFWHHLVAISGILAALVAGFSFPGIACFGLIAETSSLFLSICTQIRHRGTTWLYLLCSLAFFISYTVIRVIGFPVCLYFMGWSIHSFHAHVSYLRLGCMLFSTVQAIMMTLLNFYWYYFVIQKLIRTVKQAKSTHSNDDDFKTAGTTTGNIDDDYCMDQTKNA